MILESISILSLLASGALVIRTLGFRGWPLLGLGFLTGISLQIVVGFLLISTPISNSPATLITLSIIISLLIWLRSWKNGNEVTFNPSYCLLAILVTCGLVVTFRQANLTKWSVDSYSHLQLGALIAMDKYELTPPDRRVEIPISTAITHSPAILNNNEYFLKSLTPLIGISTLIAFAWSFLEGSRKELSRRVALDFTIAGVLLLATINRFVFNSFYINNHALFAGLLLLIASSGWLVAKGNSTISKERLIKFLSLLIPAFVLTRPEAPLIALLTLLPMLLLSSVPQKLRSIPLLTLGLSTLVWQSFLAVQHIQSNEDIPKSVVAMLLFGLAVTIGVYFLRVELPKHFKKYALPTLEIGLWLILLILASLHIELIIKSIHSTLVNTVLGEGSWGVTLVMLGTLGVAFTLIKESRNSIYLRFLITTFVPVMIGIVYILGAGYRIGNGDSLNRALMHIVPLIVLYITTLAATGENRMWFMRLKRKIRPTV